MTEPKPTKTLLWLSICCGLWSAYRLIVWDIPMATGWLILDNKDPAHPGRMYAEQGAPLRVAILLPICAASIFVIFRLGRKQPDE